MKPILYQLISDLVDYEALKRSEKRKDIAHLLNVEESYIRKIHSMATNKHYNIPQLYLLANYWKISVNDLLPNINNIKKLVAYTNKSNDEIQIVLDEMIEKIKEDMNNE